MRQQAKENKLASTITIERQTGERLRFETRRSETEKAQIAGMRYPRLFLRPRCRLWMGGNAEFRNCSATQFPGEECSDDRMAAGIGMAIEWVVVTFGIRYGAKIRQDINVRSAVACDYGTQLTIDCVRVETGRPLAHRDHGCLGAIGGQHGDERSPAALAICSTCAAERSNSFKCASHSGLGCARNASGPASQNPSAP